MSLKQKIKNRFINWLVFLGTFLVLFGIYSLLLSSYKKELSEYQKIQKSDSILKDDDFLTVVDKVQLGNWHKSPSEIPYSYFHYKNPKPKGTVRIGIFGCSFVFGAEAPPGFDYPARLAALYAEAGREEVEVINFGVNAYGMNRSFYLWNKLAKRLELDVTIFNIQSFHVNRDNTFLFAADRYGPIYGRYILEHGKLLYLPVIGNSLKEASATYYSSIPPFQYLRYDTKTPVPFRVFLPKKRKLKQNPFYFHPHPDEELKELYAAILDSVNRASKRFVLMLGDEKIKDFLPDSSLEKMDAYVVNTNKLKQASPFLYNSLGFHPSSLGYQATAEELYNFLEDSAGAHFPIISYDYMPIDLDKSLDIHVPLREFKEVDLRIEGQKLSDINIKNSFDRNNEVFDFENSHIMALIGYGPKEKLSFIPLSQPLKKSAKVRATYMWEGEKYEEELGEVHAMSSNIGRWDLREEKTFLKHAELSTNKRGKLIMKFPPKKMPKVKEVQILLDDLLILTGEKRKVGKQNNEVFILNSATHNILEARGSQNQKLDINEIPETGSIDFWLSYTNDQQERIPYLSYEIVEHRSDSTSSNL